MLRASMGVGVGLVLGAVGHPYGQRGTLSENWLAGDKGSRKNVDVILAKAIEEIEDAVFRDVETGEVATGAKP
jgi:hypothetical protein